MPAGFSIVARGPFSLRAAAGFGFGGREAEPDDGAMRLALVVDGFRQHAGVVLTQDAAGVVHATVKGTGETDALRRQVARVLSLDHDGEEFMAAGRRDPVLGQLQAEHPGQRPVLFHSPYEAAAWAVLSARRPRSHAAVTRRLVCEQLGARFELAGHTMDAFPLPERLLELEAMPGVPPEKVVRLHGVAEAALDGRLDPEPLRAMGAERATACVQELRGIGPFYAGLVVVRATGLADVLPTGETRVLSHAAHYYGRPAPLTPEELAELAEQWRPLRTWAVVLIRLAGDRAGLG